MLFDLTLEDERHGGSRLVGRNLRAVGRQERRGLQRAGGYVDDELHQTLRADVALAAGAEDGHDFTVGEADFQTRADVVLRERALVEVEFHQRLVVFGGHFHQFLVGLAVRGEFTTNEDYMPFIHSLQQGAENTRTGYLNVSVLGGNTANTEFEFLTGSTIGFLPQGSVAYQQYVQKEMPSLASYLKELDYHTVAIHPYYASGWDRDRVYPLLGFDEFLSQDDFRNPKRIRNYISDESSFAKIIELYENKEAGEPLFAFNVTMQNHSGYEEEFHNFTPDITVDGIDSKALSMYLSLVKQTDSALQGLIDYFSQAEEDTMIVFFGDHQPTTYVSNPILRNNKVNPETLTDEENLLKYKVPYVIWSNFDIEEQMDGETSANYLAMDVLENCDLPLPALQSSLTGLRKEYPVISAAGVREADGTLTTVKECGEALNDYRRLEYYLLFDYGR